MKKWKIILLIVASLFIVAGCSSKAPDSPTSTTPLKEGENLEVHYIDVDQADAILIKTPNQGTILIDGGGNSTQEELVDYLKKAQITKLDYVVATHPHEDHIGGLDYVIDQFEVGAVYMPKISHTTKTFENLLQSVKNKGLKVNTITAGSALPLIQGQVSGEFLAPNSPTYKELNDYSGVLKLTYGETSFMFTGDAETLSEEEILKNFSKSELEASVLKVGHHGSTTSSSEAFLKAVRPQLAIISCGEGNDYGHPNQEILDRLDTLGIPYKRTDLEGTIVVTSDGQELTLTNGQVVAENVPPIALANPVVPVAPVTPGPSAATDSGVIIASVDRVAEVVVLKNTGSVARDLSNFVLVSVQGDQRFTLPEGTKLAAGAELTIISGADGQASAKQLIWGKQNIWNNKADPAELYDAAGGLISSLE